MGVEQTEKDDCFCWKYRADLSLLGGATGSGKSVLLKLLLMQALHKGAEVSIADFKGGVDFPPV